ncbi:MAG: TetR/AcrR family transcriptional regulator, partial [Anaerolineae bacterium]|nr:TetR/AcrR family transcriptional regulator [Anaerolineae bacterium]
TLKSETTQEHILTAAAQVFAEKGYHQTRVDDIVEASGTSKGSVYFHFPSKQEIFFSIVDRFADILARGLKKAIDAESHGIDRVDAALRTCLDIFGKYKQLAKIFLIQATGLGEIFEEKRQAVNARFMAVIQEYLDEAIAEGDIPAMDTEVAAMAWMGAIYEVVIRWVLTGEPTPARSMPTLRLILLRSVGVSESRLAKLEESVQA